MGEMVWRPTCGAFARLGLLLLFSKVPKVGVKAQCLLLGAPLMERLTRRAAK